MPGTGPTDYIAPLTITMATVASSQVAHWLVLPMRLEEARGLVQNKCFTVSLVAYNGARVETGINGSYTTS